MPGGRLGRGTGNARLEFHVIVTHGTDTLPWCLAYLTYALKRLPCNVALVGSQVPLPNGLRRSDAPANLRGALGVLSCYRPPSVLAVCNRGTAAFAGSLVKVDKWGAEPFAGHKVIGLESGTVSWHLRSVRVGSPSREWRLLLLRTGGTVESQIAHGDLLQPGGDAVAAYLQRFVGRRFRELVVEEVCANDSVNMTPAHWRRVAERIVERARGQGSPASVDGSFSSKVGVVLLDPFKTEREYRREFVGLDGVVVAGFGGGHISLDASNGHAVLGALTDAIGKGTPVVLASQTPLGETDFLYESSIEPLRRGAITAAGLTLPHARTKLAYLLGHRHAVRVAAGSVGVEERVYWDACFTAGASFRSATSRRKYSEIKGYRPLRSDPFCDLPFEMATDAVSRGCFGDPR